MKETFIWVVRISLSIGLVYMLWQWSPRVAIGWGMFLVGVLFGIWYTANGVNPYIFALEEELEELKEKNNATNDWSLPFLDTDDDD